MATGIMGAVYGGSAALVGALPAPMDLMQPQPLNLFYIAGIAPSPPGWRSSSGRDTRRRAGTAPD
ncbi:MAG: hypothetical protein R3E50_03915 [Halioglobus sp.]